MSKHYIVVTEESLETYKKFKKEMEDEENKIEKEKENKDTEEDNESLGSDPWDCTRDEWGFFMDVVRVEQDKVNKRIQTSEQACTRVKRVMKFLTRGYVPVKLLEEYEGYKLEEGEEEPTFPIITFF